MPEGRGSALFGAALLRDAGEEGTLALRTAAAGVGELVGWGETDALGQLAPDLGLTLRQGDAFHWCDISDTVPVS